MINLLNKFFQDEEEYRYLKFDELELKCRLNGYNFFNKTRKKNDLDLSMRTIIDCYMNNPDVIALWLFYYIPENDNDKSKKDSIFLLTVKCNSNIKPTFSSSSTFKFNSNFHSSTPYIFNKYVINYENINYEELEKLQKPHKQLES
jgi:hypothetical protein